MWPTLRDQFSTTFMCLFLAAFLPWTMSWQYLDVPILAAQMLMALLLLGPVAREFGVSRAALYGIIFGLGLLAIGLGVFSLHQRIPPPPWPLALGLLALLAGASFLVSVVGVVADYRMKLTAWVLLIGSYWLLGRAATSETPVLFGLAALCTAIGAWLYRPWRRI
ncbi:MAG: hypothetical protein K2X03_26065 [Bryobacteraceae bacterium]|nr:hypothetical protein [Bryobacteraceae bacterium]